MTKKPSYQELEKTVKELKKELLKKESLEERLHFLSLAVEQSSEGIAISDLEGNLEYVNNAFAFKHGYSPDELIGKNLSIFHTPQQMPFVKQANKQIKKTGVFKGEIWHLRHDGTLFPGLMHNSLIRDEKNKPIGMMATLRDISDIKQAEGSLRTSKKRFRNLTEITSDWIWEVDKYGFYTYVSPKVQDMLGYKPEEIIGETPFDLMPPAEANRVSNIFNTIIASQQPFDCLENINLHKDGHPVVLETSGIPIFGSDGEFCGYRGIDRDISERKRAEESLRNRTYDLDERVKELNCLYGISKIRERPDIAFEEMLQEIVGLIPSSWQYPEITCARIIIEGQEYKTKNFKETVWKQTSNIVVHGKRSGILEICYIEEKPESDEGPFQKEERSLISAITERLGRVTEHKRAERALQKAHEELERRVKERTRELAIKTKGLEEINMAMTVLLKKREEDKTELEDNVLTNVKELVEPYFEKIKKTKLDDYQEAFLSIIESNLKEIISPFTRKMSLKYLNLTPTEIRIANLIRHGSSSKKIAKLQNVSPRTIDTHRKNIRRKIGIQGQRGNLRSHLLSLH